ncbi:DUF4142 domain-containing protein [Fischerella sp. PCC 9605]|uniref:DUF4142 domain-containing protein n=1 Tax=Fischerella sp. PCC 9605 TaxID=1173024 RepID=UPI00047A4836|nr:DUF4142 domain-containing protein [Fischerella sp. PCC 9605]
MLKSTIITAIVVALSAAAGCTNQSDQTANQSNQTATQVDTTQTYPTTTPTAQATTPTTTPTGQNAVSTSDREFVTQAAQSNLTEIQLGQLAQKKGATSAVQQYGQRMVQEHTQANSQLQQLAEQKNLTLPQDIGEQNKELVANLSKLSGTNFDRAYINQMVQEHEKAVSLFQRQAEEGQDPDLKAFAAKTLPNLQEHLEQARSLADNTTGDTKPTSTPSPTTPSTP